MELRSGPAEVERRAHRRLLCSEIVDVELFLPDGRRISARAIVNDIAAGGVCLQFDGEVSSSGFVAIDPGDGAHLVAAIRHSYSKDGSFFVGVSFVNYQWSPDMRWPSHCVPTLDVSGATRDEESDLLRIARTVRELK
jgi:hypothetical protein